jgi:hypothetical protein
VSGLKPRRETMADAPTYQLYRMTTVGIALQEALKEMQESDSIPGKCCSNPDCRMFHLSPHHLLRGSCERCVGEF